MNRKDLIVVAVMINAGLLVALFLSSLKKDTAIPVIAHHEPIKPSIYNDRIQEPIDKPAGDVAEQLHAEVDAPPPAVTHTTEDPSNERTVPQDTIQTVTVQKGDVLEKIARMHGVKVDEIMQLNGLANSRLHIGQQLQLPMGKPLKEAPIEHSEHAERVLYTVKEGDSLWAIAQKNHVRVDTLLRINRMTEEKAKRLRPGDRLKIK